MKCDVGTCQYCGTLFHGIYVVVVWQHDKKLFANGCPVCKRAGEFKIVGELSDARTDQ